MRLIALDIQFTTSAAKYPLDARGWRDAVGCLRRFRCCDIRRLIRKVGRLHQLYVRKTRGSWKGEDADIVGGLQDKKHAQPGSL